MGLRGPIMGLRGLSFRPERADFGFQRADFGLERADLGPERGLGGDVRTDVRTSGNSPLCPTGHRPFGAAAQKGKKERKKERRSHCLA